jgi:hypothetical protein
MKVRDLIKILEQYEDYDVICQNYNTYSLATEEDIMAPGLWKHEKKWYMPVDSIF